MRLVLAKEEIGRDIAGKVVLLEEGKWESQRKKTKKK